MNRTATLTAMALGLLALTACGEKKDETAERLSRQEQSIARKKAEAEQIRRNSEQKMRRAPISAMKGESKESVERRALMTARQRAMGPNGPRLVFGPPGSARPGPETAGRPAPTGSPTP